MRQTLFVAAAAFVIGGVATGAVLSQAQPTTPPVQPMEGPPPPPPHAMGGWGRHAGAGPHAWRHGGGMRQFALIYRHADRQLTPADVQKIAEAFLLWNGNHSWKVSNVAPTADGPIDFSLTTPEGSVVAKFTMDPHTGAINRVG